MRLRSSILTLTLLLPFAARAADIPVRYTVNDTTLRAAVNGTPLTFELYANPTCSASPVYSANLPVQDVSVISRLKVFKPKGATAPVPRTAELSVTLAGVSAVGNLYLKVTGTGVAPVGGACQAQAAAVSSGALPVVIEDANGVVIGTAASTINDVYIALPGGGTALTRVNDNSSDEFGDPQTFELNYQSSDCTGQPYSTFSLTLLQTARYRAADQTLYATPTALVPIARQSRLRVNESTCNGDETPVPPDGCCTSLPSAIIFAGPALTVPVGGFVRPFRYNQR